MTTTAAKRLTAASRARSLDSASGRKPQHLTIGRIGLYVFLIMSAAFFLLPLYVMIITSLKTMFEIRLGNLFALPAGFNLGAWVKAWSSACTGLDCNGGGGS